MIGAYRTSSTNGLLNCTGTLNIVKNLELITTVDDKSERKERYEEMMLEQGFNEN